LVLTGIIITIATAVGGYVLERYNRRKSLELKKDIDALRVSMQQNIDAITAEANRELELIREEAKRQIEQFERQ
jgi:F0F1-type ATP synthase membrane subunit b/b'